MRGARAGHLGVGRGPGARWRGDLRVVEFEGKWGMRKIFSRLSANRGTLSYIVGCSTLVGMRE